MDGFTYTNIFDTKGIEYIIIILFLLVLIPFWIFVNKETSVSAQVQGALGRLTAGILRIPQGLLFSKNHTWVHLEKSGEAKIGLDDFFYRVVGKVSVRPIKAAGELVKKGDLIAEVSSGSKHLKVYSPVSGKILAANNAALSENPDFDPYENGWFFSVKPTNWKAEISGFYLAEEATGWLTKELGRFKDFLNVSMAKNSLEPQMVVLQEGGELQMYPLAGLQPEIWNDFQEEFLD